MKEIIFVRHGESTENIANKEGYAYDKNKIVLTDKGKKQAIITGKYLINIFGKFDSVYSSPVTRCVETVNIIKNEIKYKDETNINNLLAEVGYINNDLDGLSKEEKNKFFNEVKLDNLPKDEIFRDIKTFNQFQEKLKKIENPYDKLKMTKLYPQFEKKHANVKPNSDEVKYNLKKFLMNLKETKDERILVVTHGGCIEILQKMLCNINISNQNVTLVGDKNNCCIMCIAFENDKYSLISSANTNHLTEFNQKAGNKNIFYRKIKKI